MKKQGFTLAEFLITLGVIGVIAAFLVPAINSAMPDGNKTLYLKTYDTLSETIKSLVSNSQIYTVCDNENNVNCSANPLLNVQPPLISPLKENAKYSGNVKLCNLLALSFGVNENNVSCASGEYSYADNTFKNNLSYITKNGMQWKVVQQVYSIADGNAQYQTDIYVDVNGNKGNNCLYSNDCQKPDIFKFMVAASGEVVPADPMGRKYLETRNSLLKKDAEIDNPAILASLEEYKTGLRNFVYSPCFVEGGDCSDFNSCFAWRPPLNSDPERCNTAPVQNGKPVVRSDGYIFNLRTTEKAGVFAEWFNDDSGSCTDYSNQKHYMWNPDTEEFEELKGIYHTKDIGDNNEIYNKLKDKSKAPISYKGFNLKVASFDGKYGLDEQGNAMYNYSDTVTIGVPK